MSLIKRFLSVFYPKTVSSVVIPEMSDVERASRNIPPPKPIQKVKTFPKKSCEDKCDCGREHMVNEYGCTKTFLKSPTATPPKTREASHKPKRDDLNDIGMSSRPVSASNGYVSRRDRDNDIDNTALVALTSALISEPSSSSASFDSYSSSSDSSSSSGGGDGW